MIDEITKSLHSSLITNFLFHIERFSGILYGLLAAFLFTCTNFALKQLNIIILDFLIIRYIVQALISFRFMISKGYGLFPDSHRSLLIICSLFLAAGSVFFYIGLSLLPLPDITTIRYTQVIWTAILAIIIFHERINLPIILASILTFIGIIFVAQPTFFFSQSKIFNKNLQKLSINNNKHLLGILFAFVCAFSYAMGNILNKKLVQQNVRLSVMLVYFSLISFIMILIIQIYNWIFSKLNYQELTLKENFIIKDFILLIIISVLLAISSIFMQKSIKREHPSIFVVVQASDILFALIFQNIFTSNKTDFISIIGSILILISIFIIGIHKFWLDRQNCIHLSTSIKEENKLEIETEIY